MHYYKQCSVYLVALFASTLLLACSNETKEEKIQNLLQEAMLAKSLSDIDSAKNHYASIVELDGHHIIAHKQLINIAKVQKDFPLFYSSLKSLTTIDQNDLDSHLLLGELYLSQNKIAEALATLEKLERIDSENSKIFEFKLAILIAKKERLQAIKLAAQRLKETPENLKLALFVGGEYFKNKDYDGALNAIEVASAAHISSVELHQLKANILWNKGYHQQATAVLNKLADVGGERSKEIYIRHLIKNNKVDESIRLLKVYRQENSDWMRLRLLLAELYRAKNERDNAKNEYSSLIVDAKKTEGNDDFILKNSYTAFAQVLFGEGRASDALKQLDRALKEDPHYTPALITKANIHFLNQNTHLAIKDLQNVISGGGNPYNARPLLADIYMSLGQYQQAIEQYEKLKEAGDGSKINALKYAESFLFTRQSEKAEKVISHWLDQYPNDVQALALRVQVYLKIKQRDDALADIDAIESINGTSALLLYTRGNIYQEKGKFEAAIVSYQKAFLIEPTLDIAKRLTALYIQQNKIKSAKKFISQSFIGENKNVFADSILAALYQHEGNDKKAESIYRNIIKNQPEESFVYIKLANFFKEKKNYSQAELILKNGVSSVTDPYPLQALLAEVYEAQACYSEALAVYEQMISTENNDPLPVNNFIHLVLEYKPTKTNLELAANYAKRLKNINNIAIQDTLGWLYYKLNEFDKALNYAEKASQSNPPIADIHYHLGKIHQAKGNFSRAEIALKRAVRLGENHFDNIEDAKSTLAILTTREPILK